MDTILGYKRIINLKLKLRKEIPIYIYGDKGYLMTEKKEKIVKIKNNRNHCS